MLSTEERTQITEALRSWAASAPNEPMIGFVNDQDLMTPKQVVAQVAKNSRAGQSVLEILEHGMRREGIEAVVNRLSQRLTCR